MKLTEAIKEVMETGSKKKVVRQSELIPNNDPLCLTVYGYDPKTESHTFNYFYKSIEEKEPEFSIAFLEAEDFVTKTNPEIRALIGDWFYYDRQGGRIDD